MKPAQHRACEPTLIARPLLAASGELAREELISRAANLERPREMMFAQERRLSRPPIGSRASRTQAPATTTATTMADCCATTHTDRRISRDDRLGGSRVFFAITARSLLALERHCSAAGWLAGQSACTDRQTDRLAERRRRFKSWKQNTLAELTQSRLEAGSQTSAGRAGWLICTQARWPPPLHSSRPQGSRQMTLSLSGARAGRFVTGQFAGCRQTRSYRLPLRLAGFVRPAKATPRNSATCVSSFLYSRLIRQRGRRRTASWSMVSGALANCVSRPNICSALLSRTLRGF